MFGFLWSKMEKQFKRIELWGKMLDRWWISGKNGVKWLRNWVLVKKTWLLRKSTVGYYSSARVGYCCGSASRLVHGSGSVEKTRSLPSRHMIEHLVCIGCVREDWSRPGCCPGIAEHCRDLVRASWIAIRWCPMVLGCCSGVAELVRPVTEECRWCPGKSGRCIWNWFMHFIEHLVCGFYFYFIFYLNQIKSF